METLFLFTNDHELYFMTLIVLLGLSYGSVILYLLHKNERYVSCHSQTVAVQALNDESSFRLRQTVCERVHWLTVFIKRKDSPPDDNEAHCLSIC
ncbi:hypothetical protein GCM10011391_16260 [Pullulanibacillus camelliae]|uniref:Uncharacterized protein n=1 Tax=Pullulanibacillus camelliae TaxID=1707096 RepID=A0A8J2VUB4_9BACL|nr:hypothetical protein [Pullulanibacillus camelliae]GGE38214.1 hypothetical protein GCM10011391_16260 [Pullulanibacillus camelliae]